MDKWILPLTLIPGIGLFIMSTVNQTNHLSNEINQLIHVKDNCSESIVRMKLKQLKRLNHSLNCFYISAMLLVITGVLGGAFELSETVSQILLVLASFILCFPMFLLTLFAFQKTKIKQMQFETQIYKD